MERRVYRPQIIPEKKYFGFHVEPRPLHGSRAKHSFSFSFVRTQLQVEKMFCRVLQATSPVLKPICFGAFAASMFLLSAKFYCIGLKHF